LRKKWFLCLIAGLGLIAPWIQAQSFVLKLYGGLSYADGGDLAKGIKGGADYLAADFNISGDFKAPTLGQNFGGEFIYYIGPRLGIGLGAGYFRHGQESSVSYSANALTVRETLKPRFWVVPITANLHWLLPLSSKIRLDLTAGAGYYLAFLNWEDRMDMDILGFSGYFDYTFESVRGALGFQGGVGLEVKIARQLALVWTVLGRYASLSDWKGDWTDKGGGDLWSYEENGSEHTAWYYDLKYGGTTYPQILFNTDKPTGANYSNVRAAKLSLTGFTTTLGIKLDF